MPHVAPAAVWQAAVVRGGAPGGGGAARQAAPLVAHQGILQGGAQEPGVQARAWPRASCPCSWLPRWVRWLASWKQRAPARERLRRRLKPITAG